MMSTITQHDFITSITDAFQYISYYHPPDYIHALSEAWAKEESEAAKHAMAQILINSRMCAEGRRPICQDTGIATVFLKIGMDVHWNSTMSITDMINEGVRRAYTHSDNLLRASVVCDPAGIRKNTKDNTPAVIHTEIVPGDKVEITCAAKGGGSENKASFTMLNPSDSIEDWVLDRIPQMGAGWCPPGIIGIGIGGSPEKAMLLAKASLMSHIDIHKIKAKAATGAKLDTLEALRLKLFDQINALGIGAQGLGGLTTVLDVKILDYPTHAASKPVAMIPNCAATRHITFTLDGSGPAYLPPPNLNDWPDITLNQQNVRRINLNALKRENIKDWQAGETLLLSGTLYTGRDAAHKRMADLIENNQPLPVDLNGKMIYYVGPVDPVRDEVVGPAGPTTASRMDKFTTQLLAKTGLLGMIGKSERSPETCEAIAKNKAVYLIAVGGAAYLVSKAIKSAKVIAFPELGMEAIYEFEVEDMPVTVAVDINGHSIHATAPKKWQQKISNIAVKSAPLSGPKPD
ncbi:fumarate hydratase [Cardiobacteriaceae bacterium TAE3-ERU3]|nr:fumarate hydratase [Cardiobacteriaceae bacterium TAE3-ERU3]